MKRLLEFANYIVFTLIVIGLGFLIYGGYQYYTSSNRISEIDGERENIKNIAQQLEPGNSDPQPIVMSDIALRRERNDLVGTQNTSMRMVGVGIALLAAAWLVRDFANGRRKKMMVETVSAESDSPSSA